MSNKTLLIQFDSNYADEFDVEGFTLMSEEEWTKHKAFATKAFEKFSKLPKDEYGRTITQYGVSDGLEVYFGTNEQIIYESLDSYLDSFEAVEITPEEELVLKKFFTQYEGGPVHYGILPMLDDNDDGDDDEDQ